MSCIRYFGDSPHVVRYGMQDGDKGLSWVLFWRNGTKFVVRVDRRDVLGTRFEEKWWDLLAGKKDEDPVERRRDWVHRWHMFCDCNISQCLDLLEQLAPDGVEYWTTLRDYLHTPGYEVKMVRDEELRDAKGVVVKGPEWRGAYELSPLPVERVGIVTEELRRFRSEDLAVVDREVDWKAPPHRVRTADGEYFTLSHIDTYSKNMSDNGKIENHSLDKIKTYWKIRKQCEGLSDGFPDRIPWIFGYVTDDTVPSEKRKESDIAEDEQDSDAVAASALVASESDPRPQTLVAGILLTDFPYFRTLHDIVRDAKTDEKLLREIKENKERWKPQTLAVVQDLHKRGMACGGHHKTSWPFVNQVMIHIDNEQDVWLDPLVGHYVSMDHDTVSDSSSTVSDFEKAKELDLKGVEKVYEEWLPGELKKIEDVTN